MQFLLNNFKTILLAVALVGLVLVIIKYYAKIKTFLLQVKTELGKVSWSNREELMGSTVVVIIVTAIMALFIFIIDSVLSKGLSILFRT
jgi:preprotein translocase subunit SecE